MSKMKTKMVVRKTVLVEGSGQKVYQLKEYENKSWWCPCLAFKFQHLPVYQRECKHIVKAKNGEVIRCK